MALSDDAYYRQQLEKSDNIYAELNKLMISARQLSDSVGNHILHSQALTSIIQNKPISKHLVNWRYDDLQSRIIRDFLCNIDDITIRNAVYDSIYECINAKHLIYKYNNISENGYKRRVRILTRMLWYKLTDND